MIKSVTQYSDFEKKPNKKIGRLQNNPPIGWVHPKSTHEHPLAWGNKKIGELHLQLHTRKSLFVNKPFTGLDPTMDRCNTLIFFQWIIVS
jgi:hypothetical protein